MPLEHNENEKERSYSLFIPGIIVGIIITSFIASRIFASLLGSK